MFHIAQASSKARLLAGFLRNVRLDVKREGCPYLVARADEKSLMHEGTLLGWPLFGWGYAGFALEWWDEVHLCNRSGKGPR